MTTHTAPPDLDPETQVTSLLDAHRAELGEVSEWIEGSAIEAQLAAYVAVARRHGVRSVAEIGFNLGYSTLAWLAVSPETKVVAFDLGQHAYVERAAALVARRFPGRFELVLGDSTQTVPARAAASGARFDLVYVDGDHSYDGATADLRNLRGLAAPGALVLMDDLIPEESWGEGPTRAWEEAVASGAVEELERGEASAPGASARVASGGRRVWGVGRFA